MLKAIKIKLYPNNEHLIYINQLIGTNRFIYNNCLNFKINQYKENKKSTNLKDTNNHVKLLKNDLTWIKDSHSKVIQQTLINLETAYKNFFKNNKGFPKFKSKKDKQSVRFPVDAIIGIQGNRINLIKKLYDIHFKCSRKDEIYLNKNQNKIKSATLSKTKTNEYYLSILIDGDLKILKKSDNLISGIDLGIKDFIVTSEGQKYENLKFKSSNNKKLRKLQKDLSRKEKGSINREKVRIKLAKLHEKINNRKEYYLHSVVNKLLGENQVIVIEDLNVKGMLKNHCLAGSIQELSLYRFKEILKYKASWYGREVFEISRWFPSSKLCSCCGYKNKELTLKDRKWKCPSCGCILDRDLNAAINIRNEGIKTIKVGMSLPEFKLMETSNVDDPINSLNLFAKKQLVDEVRKDVKLY
ncbi:MAG: RNA-guided endonuclease TnpB family protein [Candidatus Paceibacterota bacterium]|jgi:putative transposase